MFGEGLQLSWRWQRLQACKSQFRLNGDIFDPAGRLSELCIKAGHHHGWQVVLQ